MQNHDQAPLNTAPFLFASTRKSAAFRRFPALFCTLVSSNPFRISNFRTLCPETPGVGGYQPGADPSQPEDLRF